MDPESINSVFALFDCFGAILYEMLIVGLMDRVYQSDAYEAVAGGFSEQGKRALFKGNRGRKVKF